MKFAAFAVLALLDQASAIRYDKSEGPTKVDFGENDDHKGVLTRADDDGTTKWQKENPIGWTDDGEDDGVVLTMTDGSLLNVSALIQLQRPHHHHHRHVTDALTMIDGTMRPIYDEDGDGVEDNVKKTRDELDRFYDPAVFGVAEDIHNTHHGNLPGHVRRAEYEDAPDGISWFQRYHI